MAVRERRKLVISFLICGAVSLITVFGAVFWVVETQATGTIATLVVLGAALLPAVLFGLLWLHIDGHFLQPLVHLTRELETLLHAKPNRSVKQFNPRALEKVAHSISEIVEQSDRTKRELTSAIAATTTEIEEERAQLAAVLGNLSAGVILCAHDDTVLMCNEAARRAVGEKLSLGRRITEIFNDIDLREVFSTIRDSGNPAIINMEKLGPVRIDIMPKGTLEGHVFCFNVGIEERLPDRPMAYDFKLMNRPRAASELMQRRIDELDYVVFDTETTGLRPNSGDELIQIGAVRVSYGKLLEHETFDTLINPDRHIPPSSTRFHGITNEMVSDAPGVATALRRFHNYLGDVVLVAQNAAFDMQFLRNAERFAGVKFDQPLVDTMLASFCLHPDDSDHTLDAVATRYGVDISGRHTALGDALVTAHVLCRMLPLLISDGITTLGDLLQRTEDIGRRQFGQ